MAKLRHEVWTSESLNSVEFAIASAAADKLRATTMPDAVMQHVIYASSWEEAMQLYYDWQDWGVYKTMEDVPDTFYTDEQRREQELFRP